jgi:flap endonuclease-1
LHRRIFIICMLYLNMGLNISEIIPKKEIELDDLSGKMFCIDAFNTLYQFLSTIRQPDGTSLMDNKGRVTSHLSGIFYRNVNLLENGMKLIYVFDGEAPELKYRTHKKRGESRDLAREKYEEAKQKEDISAMRKYSSQLVRLNDEMIEESKELLEAMGIAVVQAPSEGEAEAAYLAKVKREIYSSVSQDYDSLLFGAPKLIRNLTLSRRRKTYAGWTEVKIEMIELEKVLNSLNLNLDQLICLGILVGTDYNPRGVPGLGQKKALKLVQRFRQPVMIFRQVEEQIEQLPEEDRFDWKEVFSLFHHANVENADIKFGKLDRAKIKEILVGRHNFSEDRVEKQIKRLEGFEDKKKQKGLDKWF